MKTQIRRSIDQERADGDEHRRRGAAFQALFRQARLYPDSDQNRVKIAARSGIALDEIDRIISEYRGRPHLHAVRVMHDLFGGRGCRLGGSHPGCCPGEKNCDAPGEEPR